MTDSREKEAYDAFKKLSEFFGTYQSENEIKHLGTVDEWNIEEAEKDDMILFAPNNRIKALRIKNKLTQCEFAKAFNISQRDCWRMEKPGYKISPYRFYEIAVFYNVSLDYIFGLTDDPRPLTDGKTSINGYCLEDMKKAKENGAEYVPIESSIKYDDETKEAIREVNDERQKEIDEEDREFFDGLKKAGIDSDSLK